MFMYKLYRRELFGENLIWIADFETFDGAWKRAVEGIHDWHKEWYVIVNTTNCSYTNVYDVDTYGKDDDKREYDQYGYAISGKQY